MDARSRGLPVVEPERPAQPIAAPCGSLPSRDRCQELVPEAPVGTFGVVVLDELADGQAQVGLAERVRRSA